MANNENEALLSFLEKRGLILTDPPVSHEYVEHDGIKVPYLVIHDEVVAMGDLVEEHRPHPKRREGTARFDDQNSFDDHANRFKSEHSALWADRGNGLTPKLAAIFDYHQKGSTGTPAFCRHRGVYGFPISEEWEAWFGGNEKPMTQGAFAEFIENRMMDLVDPSRAKDLVARFSDFEVNFAAPTQVLHASRGLRVHISAQVVESVNLSTGESELTFQTEHEHRDNAGQKIRTPQAFVIHIPVFRNGESVSVAVFLRYRVGEGKKPTWFFSMYQAKQAFDVAFQEACQASAKATELPLFYGTAES